MTCSEILTAVIAGAALLTAWGTWFYVLKTKELVRIARLNLQADVQLKLEEQWDGARLKAARRNLAREFTSRFPSAIVAGPPAVFTEDVSFDAGQTTQPAASSTGIREDSRPALRDILKNSNPDDDVFNFFESVGLLVRRDVADEEMAWSTFGEGCLHWWALSKSYVWDLREKRGATAIFEEFEALTGRFAKIEAKRRNLRSFVPSDADLKTFIEDEAALTVRAGQP